MGHSTSHSAGTPSFAQYFMSNPDGPQIHRRRGDRSRNRCCKPPRTPAASCSRNEKSVNPGHEALVLPVCQGIPERWLRGVCPAAPKANPEQPGLTCAYLLFRVSLFPAFHRKNCLLSFFFLCLFVGEEANLANGLGAKGCDLVCFVSPFSGLARYWHRVPPCIHVHATRVAPPFPS